MLTRRTLLTSSAAATLAACAGSPFHLSPAVPSLTPAPELAGQTPPVPREFRAAWVATVANIDWPSRKGLSTAEQQAEMRALLDTAVALKLNAIIFQIRTSADAFYDSKLEPWSEYLSGTQGQAPEPFYDPLALWISEAHARGLELHAWFNPFRARQSTARSEPHASHVSQTQPQWVKRYGDQLWIDPGEPAAADHSLAVIQDVLERYAVDGIHIDDYFYPYPVNEPANAKQEIDFPDEPSWQRYLQGGGTLARADWRRRNVDQLVQRIHTAIRQSSKPWVRFGISPFGLPKPSLRPAGIAGFSQYDKLYADVELWLEQGWMDYLVPQLYWPMNQPPQAFGVLLNCWRGLNPLQRHIWPGLFTSKVTDKADSWPIEEISGQIQLQRAQAPGSGHAHFSMIALRQNRRGLADHLKKSVYTEPALVPATPWLEAKPAAALPPALLMSVTSPGGAQATAQAATPVPPLAWRLGFTPAPVPEQSPRRYLVWCRHGERWSLLSGPDIVIPAEGLNALVVSALGQTGVEGPRSAYKVG
ncbi:hypothetical protein DBR47_11380 [Paucibacter sp. KBW04]|uniref:glycoside hydrolase family 10 protein n=1 Tax=Paucibacter sp. KBW04 TaxID=2153361 RepID=UPI000F58EDC8|nr:family 10 glycosylhydrolase [Paucibacter sp. KBW04]RQO60012.1 hypothetical protein DBR47_11380 [Paucibacter sp. KBW04]